MSSRPFVLFVGILLGGGILHYFDPGVHAPLPIRVLFGAGTRTLSPLLVVIQAAIVGGAGHYVLAQHYPDLFRSEYWYLSSVGLTLSVAAYWRAWWQKRVKRVEENVHALPTKNGWLLIVKQKPNWILLLIELVATVAGAAIWQFVKLRDWSSLGVTLGILVVLGLILRLWARRRSAE